MFLTFNLIMQNLVVVSHTVCAHVRESHKFWGRWALPFWYGTWLTPANTVLLHVCYHTKCGRSRSNRFGAEMGCQKLLGMLGPRFRGQGCGWPLETRSYPTRVTVSFRRTYRVSKPWRTLEPCSLGIGTWLTLEIFGSSTCIAVPNLGILGQTIQK